MFLTFLKSKLGVQVIIGFVFLVAVIGGYLYVQNLKNQLSEAENNVALIAREFETVYSEYEHLEVEYGEQSKQHMYAMQILKDQHLQELRFREKIVKIKTEIENVKEEDDGDLSNVLRATLNALRVLD